MPEPTKSELQKHWRQNSKVKSMRKRSVGAMILSTATQDASQTVSIAVLQATLIIYAQCPDFATVKQDQTDRLLVDAAFLEYGNLALLTQSFTYDRKLHAGESAMPNDITSN